MGALDFTWSDLEESSSKLHIFEGVNVVKGRNINLLLNINGK